MAQDDTQTFNIKACFYPRGGKGMPQSVEIGMLNATDIEHRLESVLYAARLQKALFVTCQQVCPWLPFSLEYLAELVWQGDGTY